MKSNRQLKEEYKNMKFKVGVFQVKNLVNGKIFIDSSINLDKIWNRHRVELNAGLHRNEQLQKDWKEFGESNFVFEILSEIDQKKVKISTMGRRQNNLLKCLLKN